MNISPPHRTAAARGPASRGPAMSRRMRYYVVTGALLTAAAGAAALAAPPAASAAQSTAIARSGLLGATAAAPSGSVSWSEIPASATAPDHRATFNYASVKPGTTITDHVAVLNRSSQSVAFTIYATDATGTTSAGTLILMPAAQKPLDIGSWVSIDKNAGRLSVVIPADKGVIEPFTVSVPRNAKPGDHTGALFAAVTFANKTSTGAQVNEEHRIGVPILLRVAGPLNPRVRVEAVSVGQRTSISPFGSGATTVTYTVHNTGNVRLAGTQLVKVSGIGGSLSIKTKPLPMVLPGDSVRVTVRPGSLFPFGPITAHVRVGPAAPPAEAQLAAPLAAVTGSATLIAVPWALLVVIVLIAGLILGLWWLQRMRRQRLGETLSAVAEHARKETERRLLGSRKSPAEPQGKA